jgi:hypothetical protein
MSIILRFFPNGEFTKGISAIPHKRPQTSKTADINADINADIKARYLQWEQHRRDNKLSANVCVPGQQFANQEGGIYTYLCHDWMGHHMAYECDNYVLADVLFSQPIGHYIGRGELIPLVHLSPESSPRTEKSRKVLDSMTSSMGRNIRNAVYLLEEQYGKDSLSFLTLTIPGLEQEHLNSVCLRWDYMVDQLLKAMRKRLLKKRLQFEYVYCTEIQSKRLQQRSEYVPHLHLVFRGRHGRKAAWVITPKWIRKAWANIISNVVNSRDFDTRALENLQRIRYSAARYLSKYLSKGKNCNPGTHSQDSQIRLHTQWGGMARTLSRLLKSAMVRITSASTYRDFVVAFTTGMQAMVDNGLVLYYKEIFIPLSKGELNGTERGIFVGCGCLSEPLSRGGLTEVIEFVYGQ